jgi:hypothetical protein
VASATVECIRLKNQIHMELRQVQAEVDDLAKPNVHEIQKNGNKVTVEQIGARKLIMASIMGV